MPTRKEEEPEPFKVVDRRPFTADGERRPDIPPEAPPPEPPPPEPSARPARTEPPQSPPAAKPGEPAAESAGQGAVQFEHLIMSLVSTAMFQLGMAAPPGQPPPPADLPAAQETIDLLGLLQHKTQGNLTREEAELLAGSLQELRLVFVELSRRTGRIR